MSRPRRPTRPATPKATAQIENKKRKSVIHECGVDGWQPPTKRSSCLPCGRGRQPRQSRGVERTPRRHARMCCAALSTSSVTLTLLFYSLRKVARERRLFVDAATFPAPADSFIHRAGPNRLAQPQQQYSQPRPLPPPCFHPPPPRPPMDCCRHVNPFRACVASGTSSSLPSSPPPTTPSSSTPGPDAPSRRGRPRCVSHTGRTRSPCPSLSVTPFYFGVSVLFLLH
jgi:hypothetical protein